MKRIVCEPNWLEPIRVMGYADICKIGAILNTYQRGMGRHWSGRPYVLEVVFEEIDNR